MDSATKVYTWYVDIFQYSGNLNVVSSKCFSIHAWTRAAIFGVYSFCHPFNDAFPLRTKDCSRGFITPHSTSSRRLTEVFFRKFSMLKCWTSRSIWSSFMLLFKNLATFKMVAGKFCNYKNKKLNFTQWVGRIYSPCSCPHRTWTARLVRFDVAILLWYVPNMATRQLVNQKFILIPPDSTIATDDANSYPNHFRSIRKTSRNRWRNLWFWMYVTNSSRTPGRPLDFLQRKWLSLVCPSHWAASPKMANAFWWNAAKRCPVWTRIRAHWLHSTYCN